MQRGFTLVELLIIVAIISILFSVSILAFRNFQRESDLTDSAEEIINILRLAQNKTLASKEASKWGVYFNLSAVPYQYTLFKGIDYLSRDNSFDEIYKLPKGVEIFATDLGGGQEVIFDRITGKTSQFGSVSLRLKVDISKTRIIYIENSGRIGLTGSLFPSDENRIKDSRHVHFNYSGRDIATTSEFFTLTFTDFPNPDKTENILIADNFKDNQIYWDGEVDVNGEIQELKIHTHWLNDPVLGTQFCVHRDMRHNNKALKIEISGDSTGDLIQFSADGRTIVQGDSFYVSEPIFQ